jgi:general secretion pathway protein D
VGVNIEMTPTIHFDHDVTLKIKIEDSSEDGNVTISGVTEPIIAQKTSEQVIRLREGEASILSGMVNKTDIRELERHSGAEFDSGSQVPLRLQGSHRFTEDEIIFLLVPHIVRTQELEPVNLRSIDTGVGTSIELRHVPSEGPASNPASNLAPAVLPVRPAAQPASGAVPGQSAQAAAPAALAQLRAAAESNGDVAAANAAPPPSAPSVGKVSLVLTPPDGSVAAGSTFKVPIVLNNGTDIASVPVQIQYDPAKLSLVNVDTGEFLGRDGQAVALVHRDDGPGTITLNASRPPG